MDAPCRWLRSNDPERVLGACYGYLANQAVFKIDDDGWKRLLEEGWFPFLSLPRSVRDTMAKAVRAGFSVDDHLPAIVAAVEKMVPDLQVRWSSAELFGPHLAFLRQALERFCAKDYISATAILYMRIEGIIRTLHDWAGSSTGKTAQALASTSVQRALQEGHSLSWLLPHRFQTFLDKVYFASFNPRAVPLSRHSVAHGVASAEQFDAKASVIGILADQLLFLGPSGKSNPAPHSV